MVETVHALPAPHRFTRHEYHAMGRTGLFVEARVELLEGEILTMSPQDVRHASTVHRIFYLLQRLLPNGYYLRMQAPIILDDRSEPEPDICVCRSQADDFASRHPSAGDVALVIEVAASSLAYDRSRKAGAYAGAGIPAYWIVNLDDDRLETFGAPVEGSYSLRETYDRTSEVPLPLASEASVAVRDLLPR